MKSSIVHTYIYGMLKREVNGNIIHISQIKPIVRWIVRIPHKSQMEVINELVEFGYMKKISRDCYELSSIANEREFIISGEIVKTKICDSLGNPLW